MPTGKEILADRGAHGPNAFVQLLPHVIEKNAVYTEAALAQAFGITDPADLDYVLNEAPFARLPSGKRLYQGRPLYEWLEDVAIATLGEASNKGETNATLEK